MNGSKTKRRISLVVKPISIRGGGTLYGPRLSLLIERVEAQQPERVKQ